MKKCLTTIVLVTILIVGKAQNFTTGSNDTGTIVFNDNRMLQGTVYFQGFQNDRIKFINAAGKDKVYYAGNIKKFNMGNFHFVALEKGSTYVGENSGFFVELQNVLDTSKAKIAFVHSEIKTATAYTTTGYYKKIAAIFPDGSYIVPIKNNLPPIHKLLAKHLTDCPELAKKVLDKEKGYSFKGVFNIDPIFIKVINEYNNNCIPVEDKKQ